MSAMQRRKGGRLEREIVQLHRAMRIDAERVPLSGASNYRGNGADVDVYPFGRGMAPLCCEVKGRKRGAGFVTIARWLGENDALFLRRDNADPMIVLPWRVWSRLLESVRTRGASDAAAGESDAAAGEGDTAASG